jgi:N-acyl homoserine lactone hydrolase
MRVDCYLCHLSAWIAVVAVCFVVDGASAQSAAVSLTRLACGEDAAPRDISTSSDTFAYRDLKFRLTYSCYLIRHGTEYMIWDAGNPSGMPESPKESLVDQLRVLKLRPEQIKYVGISHYHTDHTGQPC